MNEHTHRVEVRHTHQDADQSRDVSIEITKGQSGKFGWSVKAYGSTAHAVYTKISQAKDDAQRLVRRLESEEDE